MISIGSASRPIGSLFMNDAHQSDGTHFQNIFDEIHVTPPNLVFTNGQTSRWIGSGILNKPIGDFLPGNNFSGAEHDIPLLFERTSDWRTLFCRKGTTLNRNICSRLSDS